jgi:hypothetical protein
MTCGLMLHRSPMPHHLVIHFDINETILVGDEAGGDTREECLHKILAKSAFVRIPEESSLTQSSILATKDRLSQVVPTHWWDGTPIAKGNLDAFPDGVALDSSPLTSPAPPQPPPLYTGWEWPVDCCPYYRTAYKKYAKTFVRHHGCIYRPIYDQMVQQLAAPAGQSRLLFHGDIGADDEQVLSNILPAFFETLMTLFPSTHDNGTDNTPSLLEPKSRCSNTVVLRTFGTDLPILARAVTLFATGRHPRYAHYRSDQLVLEPRSCVLGRWVPRSGSTVLSARRVDKRIDAFEYQLWNSLDNNVIAAGDAQVLDFIHAHTICGIQDDYDHWDAHDCEPWAGKPVWVHDPITNANGPPSIPYHHILLDDNMYDCLLLEPEYRRMHSL